MNTVPQAPIVATAAAYQTVLQRAVLGAPSAGVSWNIRRLTIQGPAGTNAYLYIGDPAILSNFVSGSGSGQLDENETPDAAPYLVPTGETVSIIWQAQDGSSLAGKTPVGTCRMEYEQVSP